jgi:hypothetical protein
MAGMMNVFLQAGLTHRPFFPTASSGALIFAPQCGQFISMGMVFPPA